MKRGLTLLMVVLLTLSFALVGCGQKAADTSAKPTEAPKVTDAPKATEVAKKIKIGYVCKMLTNPWFIQEDWGLAKKAKELGVEYVAIDANLKDESCVAAVDNLIAQKVDAIAIVVTNQGLGAAISKKCKDAGIALCTIDDTIKDDAGKQVSHVGLPTTETGILGGDAIAKLAKDRNFFKAGNVVKVMQIDMPQLSVVHDRIVGYKQSLQKNVPELKDADFIAQGSPTGMFEDDLKIASAILNAHPEVTHWLVTGINDDAALAALKVFQENKFNLDNVIACGLGGYDLSLNEFKKGNKSYICTVLGPDVEGGIAMQMLYDNVKSKKAMPDNTLVGGKIATVENYLDFFPNGKLIYKQ